VSLPRKKAAPSFASVAEREELARRLTSELRGDGRAGEPKAGYAEGAVAEAYLAARHITVAEDEDGFALQVEVHGDVLPWLHGVPDGATVRALTQHGRTQWHVYDAAGECIGLIFHGVGSMWQWRFHDKNGNPSHP
jgi:hypothetical protein